MSLRLALALMLGILWLAGVASGVALLSRYKSEPGAAATAPAVWPEGARVQPRAGMANLLLFAHPRCPCTRASLAELGRLLDKLDGHVSAHVLFIRPEGAPDGWEETGLRSQAQALSGVEVLTDPDGEDARLFGSMTSGQVILYGADGRLEFAGGITSARGHEGDSPGADRIASLVQHGRADLYEAPVFGCGLEDPAVAVSLGTP